jgi:F420-dependent oxidoreductase-like protein
VRIGVGPGEIERRSADPSVARRVAACAEGRFSSFWLPQGTGFDALGVLQSVGSVAPSVELGVAVVPVQFQHPSVLASRALTVNEAVGGRLVLGVGVAHQYVLASRGLPYERPASYMEEYLHVLGPLLRERVCDYDGERVSCHLSLEVPLSVPAPALVVAAMGPRMLGLAGSLADGTVVWLTGLRTVSQLVVPTITAAASAAGRPAPRVIVSLPVCVTADVSGAQAIAGVLYGMYNAMPSYRATLDREGVSSPVDVAVIGDASVVSAGVRRAFEAGATDFLARVFGTPEDCARTLDVLAEL